MSSLSDMLVLLTLGATVGGWMKLSTARERAVRVARAQCLQHGLQLLDETVGLRRVRLRRVNGLRRVERRYDFEVSIDGNDREPGHLWMIGGAMSSLSLPSTEHAANGAPVNSISPLVAPEHDNVVVFPATTPRSQNRVP